jgi:ATP-dependent DNA helicase RecG
VTVELPILSGTRPEERAWVREILERGTIEDRDRVLLVHARRGEVLTNQRARELLSTGRDGAMLALRRLVKAGLLERSGTRGGTRYRLASELAPPAGLKLSREELHVLILRMAEDGPLTNQSVRDGTGLDRRDVLTLFDELVESGKLRRLGERRGTRYVLAER